jgi:hypothetical protein
MGDVRLSSPRVRVVRDGHEDLEVQTDNRDLVLWDRTRIRHKWPKFDEAAFLWLTFLSWSAARRMGAIPPDLTYERWEADVIDVANVDADDADVGLGSPTPPGPAPG